MRGGKRATSTAAADVETWFMAHSKPSACRPSGCSAARQFENSLVEPAGEVAVAVMNPASGVTPREMLKVSAVLVTTKVAAGGEGGWEHAVSPVIAVHSSVLALKSAGLTPGCRPLTGGCRLRASCSAQLRRGRYAMLGRSNHILKTIRMALTLILSHGMESGPGATKISALARIAQARGLTALRPDYRDLPNWEDRQQRLEALIAEQTTAVALVGSSIGAYISARASVNAQVLGLFLLAPPIEAAGRLPRIQASAPSIWITHGWDDELIAPLQVFEFASAHKARLLLLDGDHRLEGQVATLERAFAEFLDGLQA
jgi:pimeloyl-ACP methyl ester carboxylesterase